ncbi:hypothetical protein D3C72_481830 [compost metagenome]
MAKHPASVTHDAEGPLPTGLLRRNGRYYIRRRVPLDLVDHFRKAEIVRALGTANPTEGRERLAVEWVKLDHRFRELRTNRPERSAAKVQTGWPHNLTQDQFEDWERRDAEFAEEDAAALAAYDASTSARDTVSAMVAAERATLTPEQRAFVELLESSRYDAMVAKEHLAAARAISAPGPEISQLETPVTTSRALTGNDTILSSTATPSPNPANSAGRGMSLQQLWRRWADEQAPKPRAVQAHERVVRRFEAVNGLAYLASIQRSHVIAFKDWLISKGQTPANTNVVLTRLNTLLNFAVKNDLVATNPARGVKVADPRRRKDKRREWDVLSLNRLFASPVYAEGQRPAGGGGEAAYWLPILALYTGARQTELGQLHPDDVASEPYYTADGEERSAWVIRIVENSRRGQFVKNEGSERRIPIHADVISLGFLALAEKASKAGHQRLFPDIKAGAHGELMGNWSKWFGRYRRANGLEASDMPFHSFRHSFKHYARLSGMAREVSNELTGHETGDVADDYGGLSYPLVPLVEGIAKYRIPGVVLPAKSRGV